MEWDVYDVNKAPLTMLQYEIRESELRNCEWYYPFLRVAVRVVTLFDPWMLDGRTMSVARGDFRKNLDVRD